MNMKNYSPPVDRLLTLGAPLGFGAPQGINEWLNYLEFGIGPEHVPDLIRMATDKELNEADVESREVWGPLHAWRALGQLRAEAAIEPLMQLFHEREDNDWVGEEVPRVYGMIGPAAIPSLTAYLADTSYGTFARMSAASGLEQIAKTHPDAHADCITAFTLQLESFTEQAPNLNAFLVGALVEMKAVESAPVIERAFAAGFVDESLAGDWDEAQVDLGLKEPDEKQ